MSVPFPQVGLGLPEPEELTATLNIAIPHWEPPHHSTQRKTSHWFSKSRLSTNTPELGASPVPEPLIQFYSPRRDSPPNRRFWIKTGVGFTLGWGGVGVGETPRGGHYTSGDWGEVTNCVKHELECRPPCRQSRTFHKDHTAAAHTEGLSLCPYNTRQQHHRNPI